MTIFGVRGLGWKSWKYRVAALLDRFPSTCWTSLVCWVEYGQVRLGDVLEQGNGRCHRDAATDGCCYCGKVRGPGEGQ